MTQNDAARILKPIPSPGINLSAGEVCYFAEEAAAMVAKNQNVGSSYNSFGTTLYGHGVALHSRQGVKTVNRGTVVDKYPGHLYLTSRRIVLVAYKSGFDIPLVNLTAVEFYDDGLMVTSGAKSYLVSLDKVKKLKKVIEANNAVQESDAPAEETSADAAQATERSNVIPMKATSPKGTVFLWIGFVVMAFLAIFSLRKPIKLNFLLFFGALAAGFALHIDPLGLRKKLSPGVTWLICAIVAIAAVVLL